ncbi:MAG: nucleoside diphosphate kinase regulator protein [uncultured bacterium]|jgi:regulator of nucleoside diphosphate kinase|uniref:RNA polymerase-binding protein Rnk n=1 Tax=Geobacter sulfurreducens (strain ATCC 51573 / DSM 12127 / PCA) TaxID=243231 RepID=Q74EX3_GEOSL|nr:nucleoside diphosphate kinase regulator [Geobacter sulfurreducens]EKD36301.1 MAG: nucleoside diphosphate kinase regulator protein [uncultured bacterium]AAR34166.1 RNA polymerase-binding protein Rnk [Geobacter sulfurreducens PCA]ADI83680.1 RNA polymerase-binding protein Rnk [Geobacter sulfurreducens KN400]AJY70579.1 GreA/GreB family elongation factor [Geobacter sulfurreducens]QVW36084.1 nucleoside diphosphate kinase regulator [Geobacter sulfurreducens]
MDTRAIYVTEDDLSRLEEILDTIPFRDRKDLQKLEDELASAMIVDPKDVPPNVVTMNSRVKLRDLRADKEMTISLVFPNDANIAEGKISILSPIGTAILGFGAGDTLDLAVRSFAKKIRIEEVLYQPGAAGSHAR